MRDHDVALELRDGERLEKPWRWVCSACLALIEDREVEVLTGGAPPDKCIVCGVPTPKRELNHVRSHDAEECHRLLAAKIQKSGRIQRMLTDNVLVSMDWLRDRRVERTTPGGIVLPASQKPGDMDPVEGMVIAAGPGWFDETIIHNEGQPGWKQPKASRRWNHSELRAGDRVLVDHAISGDPYPIDGIEFRIVRESNVLGVVEAEAGAAE